MIFDKKKALSELLKLRELMTKANDLAQKAEGKGYIVNFSVHTTSNNSYCIPFEISLTKFTGNGADEDYKYVSPNPLKVALKKIDAELSRLEKMGFEIEITPQRPNGEHLLFAEEVKFTISSDELYNGSKNLPWKVFN